MLQISRPKMYRMLEAGEVPFARKLGGSWRIASQGIYGLFDDPWPARKSAEGPSSAQIASQT